MLIASCRLFCRSSVYTYEAKKEQKISRDLSSQAVHPSWLAPDLRQTKLQLRPLKKQTCYIERRSFKFVVCSPDVYAVEMANERKIRVRVSKTCEVVL